MTDDDRPRAGLHDAPALGPRLATEAPVARAAVAIALSGVVFGMVFLPQLLGLALAGLSLARREPGGRRPALLAVVVSVVLTVAWGVALALLLKWWATTR